MANEQEKDEYTVYHYTTVEVLQKLIEGAELDACGKWVLTFHASCLYYMNDWKEMYHLPNTLKKLRIDQRKIDTLMRLNGLPYAISFCNKKDSLEMWRSYADKGRGVALLFDKDTLKECFNNTSEYFLGNCEYVNDHDLVKEIEQNSLYMQYIKAPDDTLLGKLLTDTLKYKDDAFICEDEFRLGISIGNICKYKYRDHLLVPYMEEKIPAKALLGITIGPCQDFDRTAFSIKKMGINKFGVSYPHVPAFWEEIEKSNVPFRG